MGNQEELLLPVLNLIVQIPLVLALSVLWYTFIFTPFGVQEYVRTSLCDENMIKKFVFKFPEDPSFNNLKDGLKENDAEKAFCAVHTLKGVCSNLGFERLYEASYELTEKLRNRVIDNCDELYNAVERLYTDLIAKIKEID